MDVPVRRERCDVADALPASVAVPGVIVGFLFLATVKEPRKRAERWE